MSSRGFRQESTDDRAKISRAFSSLRKLGYFCRMSFMCCSSCAWAEVPDEKQGKVVFWNRQSDSSFEKAGRGYGRPGDRVQDLQDDLCLQWAGEADEILSALRHEGLIASWNGDPHETIILHVENPEEVQQREEVKKKEQEARAYWVGSFPIELV